MAQEILSTEQTYVKNLRDAIDVRAFLRPPSAVLLRPLSVGWRFSLSHLLRFTTQTHTLSLFSLCSLFLERTLRHPSVPQLTNS